MHDHYSRPILVIDNSSPLSKATPAEAAASSSGKCQSPGMRRRSNHLRVASNDAPCLIASDRIVGQRSFEKISGDATNESMPSIMDDLSALSSQGRWTDCDVHNHPRHGQCVMVLMSERIYKESFNRRVKECRVEASLTQEKVAVALGIQKDTYSKYEQWRTERITCLPHYLIERFAIIVRRTPTYILTGREELMPADITRVARQRS